MNDLLKVSGLWGGYTKGVDILRGIDMTVREGEAVGIIGLNGSGKSTLGKAIMNMIPFRKGTIEFNGEDVTSLPTHELARKGLSIMQQGGQVFQNLSVWENLEIASASASSLEQIKDIIPLLQRPKRDLQHQMADKLSGGQKHELALAMALAADPKLVILDEPSAGLSPKAVEEMYALLWNVREKLGVTIVLIEQNVNKAMEYCNRSVLIQLGCILKDNLNKSLEDIEVMFFKNN
jgi:ABC-type branched-subunit amino acid transport system ATPase component